MAINKRDIDFCLRNDNTIIFKCNLPGSGFTFLLAVATFFTGSGKLFCQWELYNRQWECLVYFISNNVSVLHAGDVPVLKSRVPALTSRVCSHSFLLVISAFEPFRGSLSTLVVLELVPWVFVDGSPSCGPCLCFANGVWVDQSLFLKPYLRQVLDSVHNTTANQVDFLTKANEVTDEVNLWAEKKTSGLIKEIVGPIQSRVIST
nr:serpin-ZX-like [Tanacetum cinerariifolium]